MEMDAPLRLTWPEQPNAGGKPTSDRIFRLPRYFALASLLVFPIALLLLAGFFRSVAVKDLIALEQEKNVTLARAFANSLWPEVAPLLASDPKQDSALSVPATHIAHIRSAVQGQSAGLSVLKVKVYDLQGRVVFSTQPGEINEIKQDNSGFMAAASGRTASELTRRDTFSAFEGQIEDRDVLSSYVPIYAPGTDGPVLGVFELYSDVTPFLAHINTAQRVVLGGSILILAFLFGLLFLIVRRAETIIDRQMAQNRRDEARVRQQQQVIATLKERERLARELHDSYGQVLAYIHVQGQAIRQQMIKGDLVEVDTLLGQMIDAAREAHEDVREHIGGLRLGAQEAPQDFLTVLDAYLETYNERYGIQTEWTVATASEEPLLSPAEASQLIRITQEALANVRKHANASRVGIHFSTTEDHRLRVVIEDDGHGFNHAQIQSGNDRHYGLQIMRERTEEVGGQFQVVSRPGKGTKVVVELPGNGEVSAEAGAQVEPAKLGYLFW